MNVNVNVPGKGEMGANETRANPIARALDDASSGMSTATLLQVLNLLREHRWLIIAVTVLVGSYFAYDVRQKTPLYTAYATVVLEPRSEQVINFDSVVPQFSINYYAISSEAAQFRTDTLMARVVDRLKLEENPNFNPWLVDAEPVEPSPYSPGMLLRKIPFVSDLLPEREVSEEPTPPSPEELRTQIIDTLLGGFSVTNIDSSYLFTLSFQSADPASAALILNTIAEEYIAQKRDVVFETTQAAMDWLSGRVVELKTDLEGIEQKLKALPADRSLISEEILAARTAQLSALRDRLRERRLTAETARAEREKIETALSEQDFTTVGLFAGNPRIVALASTLAENPGDASAKELFMSLVDARLVELRSRELRAGEQVEALDKTIRESESELKRDSADLIALRQLEREAEASRLVYEYSLGRLKEISVQQGIQTTPARILAPARVPVAPSYPNIPRRTFIGIVIGLMLGIGLAYARSLTRTTLRNSEEISAAFGLPVIGVTPRYPTSRPQKIVKEIKMKPGSAMAEAVRNLRTSIQLSNVDAPPKVIMVTSSVPGEGKTVLSITLAQTIAMSGRSVILIDADLRRRFLGRYIEVKSKGGLVSLLTGKATIEELVVRDEDTGLDILLGEAISASSTDLFSSKAFGDLIDRLREQYDYVIVDTPPVLAVSDARMIALTADATVYALKWDSTSRNLVQSGLDLLRQGGAHLAGVALTQINPRKLNSQGYYGYGAAGREIARYYSQRG